MNVFVVDAVHTPFSPAGKDLAGWHPVDLIAQVLGALQARCDFDSGEITHVVFGCATPIGEQARNVGRNGALGLGWPESTVGMSIDGGDAGSGHLALQVGAFLIESGCVDACIVGGVESASRVAIGSSVGNGVGKPYGPMMKERYKNVGGLIPPGAVAERLANRYQLTREALDSYAISSRKRFHQAFQDQIHKKALVNLEGKDSNGKATFLTIVSDQEIDNPDLGSLKGAFNSDGVITAGNFSIPGDGASAILLSSEKWSIDRKLNTLARITAGQSKGSALCDGDSGSEVARSVCAQADMQLSQIDRFDVDEDCAVSPLAFSMDAKVDYDLVNCEGGALSYGHALGASGPRLVGSLAHAISRGDCRFGMAVTAGTSEISLATLLARP